MKGASLSELLTLGTYQSHSSERGITEKNDGESTGNDLPGIWGVKPKGGRKHGTLGAGMPKKTRKVRGQEETACGLQGQDGLRSYDGGRCHWTLGEGMPKKKQTRRLRQDRKACWLQNQQKNKHEDWVKIERPVGRKTRT